MISRVSCRDTGRKPSARLDEPLKSRYRISAPSHCRQRAPCVHPTNPRYFTADGHKAVFLTGSHTWSNLQDTTYEGAQSPPPFDFDAYLAFLKRTTTTSSACGPGRAPSIRRPTKPRPTILRCLTCEPALGTALDGKPRFDLARFNEAYFERLRERAKAARDEGIYVSVMLFQGFSVESKGNLGGDPWEGHPANPKNNVNGVNGEGGVQAHTLSNPDITAVQEAYVRKVIDTVNDLDNVLYEVTNEDRGGPAGTAWQVHFIRFVKEYEAKKPKQHPVGMTAQYPEGKDEVLFESPADWVSPAARFLTGDGRKVIVNDTDHSYFWTGLKKDGIAAQRAWVWKNFTRGNQCLFMDPYLDPSHDRGRNAPTGGRPDPYWEPLRRAMGQTRTFATRMDLAAMVPRPDLASSEYCLANPGKEYLVYSAAGGTITVDLTATSGRFAVEWFDPSTAKTITGFPVSGGSRRGQCAVWRRDCAVFAGRIGLVPHTSGNAVVEDLLRGSEADMLGAMHDVTRIPEPDRRRRCACCRQAVADGLRRAAQARRAATGTRTARADLSPTALVHEAYLRLAGDCAEELGHPRPLLRRGRRGDAAHSR